MNDNKHQGILNDPNGDADASSQPPLKCGIARGRWQLAAIMLAVVVLWGIVFPAISESESHRAAMQQLEDRGIDPMALFYTDHPSTSERLLKK